ncbi:MAG TPA: ankyrin repeat domain-containing protein, partial [Chthoniobacterales bacterium]|nr:ankyrin repeat domain-containing protein [Chthoniobacterales bacterium]
NQDGAIAQRLLDGKADVNIVDRSGTTPLLLAISNQDGAIAQRLLDRKADVNIADQTGTTPLLKATMQHDAAMVQRLLDAGANVDVADHTGTTPAMIAASYDNGELLRALVSRSSNLNAADVHGRTAAHHAIASRNQAAVELLLPTMAEIQPGIGATGNLIELACETGDERIIGAVLNRAPSTLEWTPGTYRALDLALTAKNGQLTKLLISRHPAPPMKQGTNVPLLAHAMITDDTALFTALLTAGVNPDTTLPVPHDKAFVAAVKPQYLRSFAISDEGITMLMIAAGLGREDYVRALLDAGAERNRSTVKHKMLALYFAARTDSWRCMQMLLGKGPSPSELRIEISLAAQRASVIKDGTPVYQTAISSGRKGFDTPSGEYVVTDKKRSHKSTIYHVNMPFFMRLNGLDFGLHQGVVPNYPASHGCIRLPTEAAQKLFAEIPVGTVVMIN